MKTLAVMSFSREGVLKGSNRMNNQTNNPVRPNSSSSKFRFSYIVLVLSFAILITSLIYSSWRRHNEHEANLPKCGIETVVAAIWIFHQQTGRFPKDFLELDERIWKGAKREQISVDGKSLNAPSSHYFYTLHVISSFSDIKSEGKIKKDISKAGIWAVPTGSRSNEAATHFWYITPNDTERWMGPALTSQNINAVKTIPTEQQLTLLVMTKQSTNNLKEHSTSSFPFLGF